MPPESQFARIPWLAAGQAFPPVDHAWGKGSPAPGLLAAGGMLDIDTLCRAYSHGIFPWFSQGQPTLWWSPDPRMVLETSQFRVHTSFAKTLRKFCRTPHCQVRMDANFEQVITACATNPRGANAGTWIVPHMIAAYIELHRAGFAHSMETWIDGQLVGGLYFVAIGKAVFGESMFSRTSDASKIALAALVNFCRHHAIAQIDCQQNTQHLASLGAQEISRDEFITRTQHALTQTSPEWKFDAQYWQWLT